jgi:tetratricopeptide (TPR) repeat protein
VTHQALADPEELAQSKASSSDARALNQRGIALFQSGDRAGALAAFRAAAVADHAYCEPWNNAGLLLHGLGRYSEAVAHFEQALAVRADYPEAFTNRGRARQALGDFAGARADFDQALALAPVGHLAAFILHNRGRLRQDLGDLAGARADFDHALEFAPEHLPTYLARGGARKELGDLDSALADFNHVLQQAAPQTLAAAYHGRGGVRVLQNNFTGALEDYERALALEPTNYLYHISRGSARYHLRDFEGTRDYRTALRMDAEGACREFARLITADARRDPAFVLANCAKHLRLNRRDAGAYARRGLTLFVLGRDGEAEADLARFTKLAPDLEPHLRRVLDLLRERRLPDDSTLRSDRPPVLTASVVERVFSESQELL